jgi:hypothetical protein
MQALAQCMSERDAISVTSDAFVYRLKESWVTQRCVVMSDDTKENRFKIIQNLNGTDITLDIIIKFLLFIFLQLLKCTSSCH